MARITDDLIYTIVDPEPTDKIVCIQNGEVHKETLEDLLGEIEAIDCGAFVDPPGPLGFAVPLPGASPLFGSGTFYASLDAKEIEKTEFKEKVKRYRDEETPSIPKNFIALNRRRVKRWA